MEDTILKIPDNFEDSNETIMSNSDGTVDNSVADAIKGKTKFAQYAGWNFCGNVWWQFDKWNCEVWTYHTHQETISADSLQEIMQKISEIYGHD